AISNGITAFREPRSRNAGITLIWLGLILSLLFLGISFLTREIQAVPSEMETVISQLARTVYDGQGLFYLLTIAGTTSILILAANTSFAGFPRLSAMLASDGFMPRQLSYRGSRLVHSYGIVSLGIASSLLIVLFQASVTRLIPLYGIGAVCTAIVMCVFIITKFVDGAWIVLVATPIFISILLWIHRHYMSVAN